MPEKITNKGVKSDLYQCALNHRASDTDEIAAKLTCCSSMTNGKLTKLCIAPS